MRRRSTTQLQSHCRPVARPRSRQEDPAGNRDRRERTPGAAPNCARWMSAIERGKQPRIPLPVVAPRGRSPPGDHRPRGDGRHHGADGGPAVPGDGRRGRLDIRTGRPAVGDRTHRAAAATDADALGAGDPVADIRPGRGGRGCGAGAAGRHGGRCGGPPLRDGPVSTRCTKPGSRDGAIAARCVAPPDTGRSSRNSCGPVDRKSILSTDLALALAEHGLRDPTWYRPAGPRPVDHPPAATARLLRARRAGRGRRAGPGSPPGGCPGSAAATAPLRPSLTACSPPTVRIGARRSGSPPSVAAHDGKYRPRRRPVRLAVNGGGASGLETSAAGVVVLVGAGARLARPGELAAGTGLDRRLSTARPAQPGRRSG